MLTTYSVTKMFLQVYISVADMSRTIGVELGMPTCCTGQQLPILYFPDPRCRVYTSETMAMDIGAAAST